MASEALNLTRARRSVFGKLMTNVSNIHLMAIRETKAQQKMKKKKVVLATTVPLFVLLPPHQFVSQRSAKDDEMFIQ